MALTLDPVFAEVLSAQAEMAAAEGLIPPKRGDALGLRQAINSLLPAAFAGADPGVDVTYRPFHTAAEDGSVMTLRWYTKGGSDPGSAIVYIHGGGMVSGSIELYDPVVRQYVQWTGVPMLSVQYRLAPEVTGDTPARDSYAGVKWLIDHADEFGLDRRRIAIMGDSGGGGVAAGTAILARDRGASLAGQLLIFPMLDDRNIEADPHLAPTATWTYDNNYTGWHALLGDDLGTDHVSRYASPARNTNFANLAPAYIEVGALDIFRDESISYALNLLKAGVNTELHVHPGSPHSHDWLAVDSPLAQRWKSDRIRVIKSI